MTFNQALIDTINTPINGSAADNGTQATPNGVDGIPAAETVAGDSFADSTADLALNPSISGVIGGGGFFGLAGADGVPSTVVQAGVQTTVYSDAAAGGDGGSGGKGGAASFLFTDDAIGSSTARNGGGVSLTASIDGGAPGFGGGAGAGGNAGSTIEGGGTPTVGGAGGAGGRGGNGGIGGSAVAAIDRLFSATATGARFELNAVGGLFTIPGDGGAGGDGAIGGRAGDGGAGSTGGDGSASIADSTISDLTQISIGLQALGGEGIDGGSGAQPGAAITGTPGVVIADRSASGGGSGGNGGNGGNASATLSDTTLTAPVIALSLAASSVGPGAGGPGHTADPTASLDFGGVVHNFIGTPAGVAGAPGLAGRAVMTITGNHLNLTGSTGLLNLTLAQIASGGLAFSGNVLAGTGASELDLAVQGGGVRIDAAADSIAIGGSPDNAMTGFTSFRLDSGDTFVAGSGDSVFLAAAADTVVVTPDSGDLIVRNAAAGNPALQFLGFGPAFDTLDEVQAAISHIGADTDIALPGGHMLTLVDDSFDPTVANVAFAACYVAGTLIRTDTGERPIERLAIGDRVATRSGAHAAIRWLGHRSIDCARHPDPSAVWPVLVRAGGFGPALPRRDLWLSPGHNLAVDGVLMPVGALLNGCTVMQAPQSRVTYWHLELDVHDIVFAEGLPAESYLDTGNRAAFVNGGTVVDQHPDFAPRHWSQTCLELVFDGPAVERVRDRLRRRAEAIGHRRTDDPAAYVLADGRRFAPVEAGAARIAFSLPDGCIDIVLHTRSFMPAQNDPTQDDRRRLGVCAGRLLIDDRDLDLACDKNFGEGWHPLERYATHAQRWTTGSATLPAGARHVVIDLAGAGAYWVTDRLCDGGGPSRGESSPSTQRRMVPSG